MHPTRFAVFATLVFATTAQAGAGMHTRYLDLVNRAHDSVTHLEVAPAGSAAFKENPLGASLRGGGDSTTIEIAGGTCLYDFRFRFRDGRTLVYKDVDTCNGSKLVIRRLPPKDDGRLVRSQPSATR